METAQIWNEFSTGLRRFIRARVSTDADADDVLQDVFEKVIRNQDRLREQERVAGWVFRIASNAVHDHHRAPRQPVRVEPPVRELSNEVAAEELAFCVEPFIDALDEPYRSALRWTELDGLTQVEAAARAGISVSGMKSRVQRGRQKLRGAFETCCEIQLDARNRIVGYEPNCDGSC